MANNAEACISTVDSKGVPYHARLKRARESAGKSSEEIAALLGISFRDYAEWENYEGELNTSMTLGELFRLSSVLGIRTRLLFEEDSGDREGPHVSAEQLCAKIKAHLSATGMSMGEFEDQVGFVIEPCLRDPSEVLKWNVDCLRFVCNEIGIDWRSALP